jgi:hypothetical protein
VAIDSVAYDFLLAEWPDDVKGSSNSLMGGAEDYLHEAAEAQSPRSSTFYDPDADGVAMESLGVHEHWNNFVDKQYSRNLGTGDGIELVYLPVSRPKPHLAIETDGTSTVLSWSGAFPNLELQAAGQVGSDAPWTPVPGTAALVEGQYRLGHPKTKSGPVGFYRLVE